MSQQRTLATQRLAEELISPMFGMPEEERQQAINELAAEFQLAWIDKCNQIVNSGYDPAGPAVGPVGDAVLMAGLPRNRRSTGDLTDYERHLLADGAPFAKPHDATIRDACEGYAAVVAHLRQELEARA